MQLPSSFLTWPMVVTTTVLATTILAGCEAKPSRPTAAQIQSLAEKTKNQLVPIQGGEFLMGDFGEIHNSEQLPYTAERHDGPVHKVVLSNFSILKHKVSLADYDVFAASEGLPLPYEGKDNIESERNLRANPKSPGYPAGVNWQDAQRYCVWIGKQIKRNMDLPTEAEWEYVARSRGKMVVYPTDNGKAERGRNYPSSDQIEKTTGIHWGYVPVGMYPPNPIGLHDLGYNGIEWVLDWYSDSYYASSTGKNPTGPANGIYKAARGKDNISSLPSATFERSFREPDLATNSKNVSNIGMAFRCVARDNPLTSRLAAVAN